MAPWTHSLSTRLATATRRVTTRTIINIENADKDPRLTSVYAVTEALGARLEDLVGSLRPSSGLWAASAPSPSRRWMAIPQMSGLNCPDRAQRGRVVVGK